MFNTHLAIQVSIMIFVVFTFSELLGISVTKLLVCQTICYALPTETQATYF